MSKLSGLDDYRDGAHWRSPILVLTWFDRRRVQLCWCGQRCNYH